MSHDGKSPGMVADPTVPLPTQYTHLKERGYKALKYGNTINMRGPGLSTHIMDEIIGKQNSNKSVVIVCTGGPGTGKTYIALRWAQKLDPNFHIMDTPPPPPKEDHGQATFDRQHIQYLVGAKSPLKRGQVIVMDEFHFGGGARGWQNRDQQQLVNLISAIRSKGYVLILVVLHTKMVDAMVRNFVLNYEFSVKDHGKAIAYRRWFPDHGSEPWKKRLGPMDMEMPDEGLCDWGDCFKCASLHNTKGKRCETMRAIYERRKEYFLNKQTKEDEEEATATTYQTHEEIATGICEVSANIPRKPSGAIHRGQCITWLKEQGYQIRYTEQSSLIQKLKDTYG